MRYAQVPQDGALVVLRVGGVSYRYHTGGNTIAPFLCEQPLTKRPRPARTLEPRPAGRRTMRARGLTRRDVGGATR